MDAMVLQSQDNGARFVHLLDSLPPFEQRTLLSSVLQKVSKEHLSVSATTEADASWWKADSEVVSAAAGLIKILVAASETRQAQLMAWLTNSSGAGVGEGIGIRRAVVAVLDKSEAETLLEKSMQLFGDQLYIRHTPTIQQEGMSETSQINLADHLILHSTCTSPAPERGLCP